MRMRASAVLLWFCSTVAGAYYASDDNGSDSPLSVETWRDENTIAVKFASICDGCSDENDPSYIFELNISGTESVCGESNIVLNHKPLDLVWDGVDGIGSGTFPADMTNGSRNHDLSLNYQALCIASPQDSIEEYTAQILTVTFHPSSQTTNDRTSGFAVSFNSAGKPQIFRLVASPVEISDEDTLDPWLDPADSFNTPISASMPEKALNSNDGIEADLKSLHALKSQLKKLQEDIKTKEHEIRKHLLRDCTSVTSRLRQCASLPCFIKTSFKIVPDVFRLVRYKFGPLPSSVSESPCRPSPHVVHGHNDTQPKNSSNASIFNLNPNGLSPTEGTSSNNESSNTLFPNTLPNHPALRLSHTKLLFKDLAIILLIASLLMLAIRHCRNSPSCRRRRVDIAARREERRTRNAYIIAARRYRWRQWWNSRFGRGARNPSSRDVEAGGQQQRLARVNEEGDNDRGQDSNSAGPAAEDAIQAEILGFRRVLEFVGELVRPDNERDFYLDNSSSNPRINSLRQEAGGSQRDISRLPYAAGRASTAPSSVAPLTTIGSPRTSTVLSYETDSSVTLDSLDPETATMTST
ncbi:hypothetical protein AJ79_05758 [Helicocarpus griseus UAMH5409]|uniref:GOLD domain-containing protein n=1 Tax=Helicocarpus griseus UAMH5409 TaxID=1447875 RepID=A0A2B7XJE0_9EURO|nr:hypothetical protein AJ79_05758 [Helicocarpus griseus UAMH5409]